VFINTVDANTGYTADVAMGSFICQCANAGYTADAAMHSYICQTQDCSYSSTHFYQHLSFSVAPVEQRYGPWVTERRLMFNGMGHCGMCKGVGNNLVG
jgi:hypothetical protein